MKLLMLLSSYFEMLDGAVVQNRKPGCVRPGLGRSRLMDEWLAHEQTASRLVLLIPFLDGAVR